MFHGMTKAAWDRMKFPERHTKHNRLMPDFCYATGSQRKSDVTRVRKELGLVDPSARFADLPSVEVEPIKPVGEINIFVAEVEDTEPEVELIDDGGSLDEFAHQVAAQAARDLAEPEIVEGVYQ
jgi:hypothetical protein